VNEHRYILDKSSKKYLCPVCNKKRFVRYIDIQTGNYLPENYGRCDREVDCHTLNDPYSDGYAKMIREQEQGKFSCNWKPHRQTPRPKALPKPEPVFIPVDVLKRTLQGYEQNIFIQNLLSRVSFPFEVQHIEKIISLYYLGTVCNGYRTGAITFPFFDNIESIRAIQVKQFDQKNHTTGTDFLHSIIEKHYTKHNKALPEWLKAYNKNELKISCLFGEHLLNKYPCNPIALVEAPKTAIYGTLYFGFPEQPENLLWLAVYNLTSLSFNKCKVLKGRDVYLFPDLSKNGKAFELWSNKAKEFEKRLPGTKFIVSDPLEKNANESERLKGCDLADYLIKQDWRNFRTKTIMQKPEPALAETSEKCEPSNKTFSLQVESLPQVKILNSEYSDTIKKEPPENWTQDITELETFFSTVNLPDRSIKLNPHTTITDVPKFIESHITPVKANNGNRTFVPYLNRLQELKQVLILNTN